MINNFNPVLLKELKLRFRNAKSFSSLAFYLIALTVFILAYFTIMTGVLGNGYIQPNTSFILFCCLTMLQIGLLLFMAPALTASSISSEREKQTLNMLLTTTQTSTQIIVGKLTASLAFLIVMLIATLPMYSILFLFGGVSPTMLGSVFLIFLLTVFSIGSVGLLFSTITKKTIVSMISTYGVTIFLSIFTGIFFFVGVVNYMPDQTQLFSYIWISLNPFAVALSVISPEIAIGIKEMTQLQLPPIIVYSIVYLIIGISSLLIAIKKLRATN